MSGAEKPAAESAEQGHFCVLGKSDCALSVASRCGHVWNTVWDHPFNSELRRLRGDPSVLMAGDRLWIPALRPKQIDRCTNQRHVFVKKSNLAYIRIQFLEEDRPQARVRYTLDIDGTLREGTTDDGGWLNESISPDAREGRLSLQISDDVQRTFDLKFGELDPLSQITGLQARLEHLGFRPGPVDGNFGPKTQDALRRFQREHRLPETGEYDDETRSRLLQEHKT